MRTVVNNNVLCSSDYIPIVLPQENFESLCYYFFIFTCEVGIMIYIVDGCCEIWVCELLQHRVWNLGASCRLDLHAHYKNEIFVSHWPARCNKVRVNRKKKKADGWGILDGIYVQWRKTI